MEYQYESLTPDSFQHLVQALLSATYPDAQCYPVGQADGGRDFIVFTNHGAKHGARRFVLYQIKFSRTPEKIQDPAAWLEKQILGELPKINSQLIKGAESYILVTNVRGSAFPASGDIDAIDALLTRLLPIPGKCWWRDDLSRKLDSEVRLRWAFPELIHGRDLLNLLAHFGTAENRERRENAIRAMLAHQAAKDGEVKFKQVELRTQLLDLFVDTSFFIDRRNPREDGEFSHALRAFQFQRRIDLRNEPRREPGESRRDPEEEGVDGGTVEFCLSRAASIGLNRLVIEGAPGQGKSTLSQYLCQVHRIRLLPLSGELMRLPERLRAGPLRLPIRVDLRDLASWLERKDPFGPDPSAPAPEPWFPNLEAFLAHLVQHASGGARFDVSDLIDVFRRTPALVVFDGLDEVANIKTRQDVIDTICAGVNRLTFNSSQLQVIVTSRPAAFQNAPTMPVEEYRYIRLASLSRTLILEYAHKWSMARGLDKRDEHELLRVLTRKMDQSHLRDLARNPMQLAILLNLMSTRGVSLPEKRTALYREYMELFANRESEKSAIVREYRDLLFNLHRHIAWQLHSEAEVGGGGAAGRIQKEHLETSIRAFLERDGHEASLAGELFQGVVERVMALVSRVQGTYEFEVQPLREYFAASYLYETAPYSPLGDERRGTKPDRFAALARNPYWLNVTRFYAGCYSKGELASLIDGLRELKEDGVHRYLFRSRALASILLSDWVFSQQPRSVREVVALMFDEAGIQQAFSIAEFDRGQLIVLAEGHAKDALIRQAWRIVENGRSHEFRLAAARLIFDNGGRAASETLWRNAVAASRNQGEWFEIGLYLGHVGEIEAAEAVGLMRGPERAVVRQLLRARRIDVCDSDAAIGHCARALVLDGARVGGRTPPNAAAHDLVVLAQVVDVARYMIALKTGDPRPLAQQWNGQREDGSALPVGDGSLSSDVAAVLEVVREQSRLVASEWQTSVLPWGAVVDSLRGQYGDCWAACRLAICAAGIRAHAEQAADCPDLFDVKASLVGRARYARLRAGHASWWEKVLAKCASVSDIMWSVALVATWGGGKTLVAVAPLVAARLAELEREQWHMVYEAVRDVVVLRSLEGKVADFESGMAASGMDVVGGGRLAGLLMLRASRRGQIALYNSFVRGNEFGEGEEVLRLFGWVAFVNSLDAKDWEKDLDVIRRGRVAARSGFVGAPEDFAFAPHRMEGNIGRIPLTYARKICGQPDAYPHGLVGICERRLAREAQATNVPLLRVAERDCWFE